MPRKMVAAQHCGREWPGAATPSTSTRPSTASPARLERLLRIDNDHLELLRCHFIAGEPNSGQELVQVQPELRKDFVTAGTVKQTALPQLLHDVLLDVEDVAIHASTLARNGLCGFFEVRILLPIPFKVASVCLLSSTSRFALVAWNFGFGGDGPNSAAWFGATGCG